MSLQRFQVSLSNIFPAALLGSVGTEDVLELEGQISEAFRSRIALPMAFRTEI